MSKTQTAYLIEVKDWNGNTIRRRITLDPRNGMDYLESLAAKLGGTLFEKDYLCTGRIICPVGGSYSYTIDNIAMV